MNENSSNGQAATWRSPYSFLVYRVAAPVHVHYHVAAPPFSPHRNLLINSLGALLALSAVITIVSTVVFGV